ncbi:hypothetical protein STEG23_019247 [Scotinomys teguina]
MPFFRNERNPRTGGVEQRAGYFPHVNSQGNGVKWPSIWQVLEKNRMINLHSWSTFFSKKDLERKQRNEVRDSLEALELYSSDLI